MYDENLLFSYNWNNKLYCDCFTTIRVHNQMKYFEGATKRVLLENQKHGAIEIGTKKYIDLGEAKILQVSTIAMNKISDGIAYVDTGGYTAKETRDILTRMHPEYTKASGGESLFDFVILRYTRKTQRIEDQLAGLSNGLPAIQTQMQSLTEQLVGLRNLLNSKL